MKKISLLVLLFLLPFLVFAQEVSISGQEDTTSLYSVDTAKKFKRIQHIIKDAEKCLQLPLKVNLIRGGYGCIYNIEEIKYNLESENLDVFLKDDNNEIVLDSVAEYITDKNKNIYHDNYELLVTIGINPIEAAIRTEEDRYIEEALNYGKISYSHWKTYISFGIRIAKEYERNIKVKTNQKEIQEIKEKIENKKPLIDNFKKEMRKWKKAIRIDKRNKRVNEFNNALQKFEDKLDGVIEPPAAWMRLIHVMSRKS